MDTPITARKKPLPVQALQWTGDNDEALARFTDGLFNALNLEDRESPDLTAEVYDRLHETWIPLHTGDWVMRGVRGEFYPCEREVFAETYEQITEEASA